MNRTLNFCTLFDSNYLTRGLAMYESLRRNCPDFHLYIFAFDSLAEKVLKGLDLEHATVISLPEFEDNELLKIKPTRTQVEYCWTCTPSVVLYCLEMYKLSSCTYLDADIFFFGNPGVLIEEMGTKDVLITEHRFSEKYRESVVNGIYNVQFLTFKNNENGIRVLQWWRNACLDWCYARLEDGKLGDQKYLDDWTTRFSGIHVLQHLGGGMGPWNIQQYEISRRSDRVIGKVRNGGAEFTGIFYHFHNFKIYNGSYGRGLGYDLSQGVIEHIYKPYLAALESQYQRIQHIPEMVGKGYLAKEVSVRELWNELNKSDYQGHNVVIHNPFVFGIHFLKKFFSDCCQAGVQRLKTSS